MCWGSFLNVVAIRLIEGTSLLKRSACPRCHHTLSWYHLIPLLSWLCLQRCCAFCKQSISWIYPVFELLTAVSMYALWLTVVPHFFAAYFILFSLLLVTIRSDCEYLLIISPLMWLGTAAGLIASYADYLPISLTESFMGAFCGFGSLWLVRTAFFYLRGVEGLGEGDLELLMLIGAFIGPLGVLYTVMLGSIAGSLYGISQLITTKAPKDQLKLPFGAFLAAGAVIYILTNSLPLFF